MNDRKQKTAPTGIFPIPYSSFLRGFSLVEVIIGTSLILLSLTGLTTAYTFYLKAGLKNTDNLKSAFLLQEGVEAVTLMRDDAWGNISGLTAGTEYYLSWNGAKWATSTTPSLVDGTFTRTVKTEGVYRKTAGQDIVDVSAPDPKALDANTAKLTVFVSWGAGPGAEDRRVVTFLTNLFE